MLTLHRCCPPRFISFSRHCKFLSPLSFTLSFSRKPSFLPNLSLPLFLNPNLTMSSRPSAFDTLMSNARAAAKRKPQAQSKSPKKPKTLDPQNPSQSLNPCTASTDETKLEQKEVVNEDNNHQNSSSKCEGLSLAKLDQGKDGNNKSSKKPRVNERIAELKSKILLLKKKAADFDPKMVACLEERVSRLFSCL